MAVKIKIKVKSLYRHAENGFEKLVSVAIAVLGNSLTFLVALCVVIYWLTNKQFYSQDIHACISDVILGIAFLSLFIIQKSSNRFAVAMHLKVNELVASHEPANNTVIGLEKRTEYELSELSKEYADLADIVKEKIEDENLK